MREKDHSNSRELFGKTVKAGSRVYFIDAKEDGQGNRYLVVSESHINAKTKQRERQRVFVYQEDIKKFIAALTEVSRVVDAQDVTPKSADELGEPYEESSLGSIETMSVPDVDQFLSEEA